MTKKQAIFNKISKETEDKKLYIKVEIDDYSEKINTVMEIKLKTLHKLVEMAQSTDQLINKNESIQKNLLLINQYMNNL